MFSTKFSLAKGIRLKTGAVPVHFFFFGDAPNSHWCVPKSLHPEKYTIKPLSVHFAHDKRNQEKYGCMRRLSAKSLPMRWFSVDILDLADRSVHQQLDCDDIKTRRFKIYDHYIWN